MRLILKAVKVKSKLTFDREPKWYSPIRVFIIGVVILSYFSSAAVMEWKFLSNKKYDIKYPNGHNVNDCVPRVWSFGYEMCHHHFSALRHHQKNNRNFCLFWIIESFTNIKYLVIWWIALIFNHIISSHAIVNEYIRHIHKARLLRCNITLICLIPI